jgi:hypothetical protein
VSPWLSNEPEGRNDRQPDDLRPARRTCGLVMPYHRGWPPGQVGIAAAGGADRRSAKNAAVPHGSIARSAPCGAAAPLPRGGMTSGDPASGRRGVRGWPGVGISVEIRVGVAGLGHGGTGPGPPGLRSLPAKQHAPKARPSPATDRGWRGRVPGRPSRTNGYAVGELGGGGVPDIRHTSSAMRLAARVAPSVSTSRFVDRAADLGGDALQRPTVRTPNFAPDGPSRPGETPGRTAVGRHLLARRKSGMQIPSPPSPIAAHRPC